MMFEQILDYFNDLNAFDCIL